MMIGKAIRWLLVCAAGLVVVWSFGHVGLRLWREYSPNDHRTHLTILQWGDASEEQIVINLVADYEKAHPDIKITRIHAADYDTKLKTMLAANTPPDLFYLSYENVPEYARLHLLTPLDPLIANKPDGAKWLGGFYPLLVDAFRYDGQQSGRGPLYGIPKDFTTMVMYVNTDLFKQAGIEVPYGGWTWDEFEADCKKISALPADSSGRFYGGVLNTWPAVLQNIIQTFGGDFFNGSNFRDMTIDSPDSLDALRMIHRTRFEDNSVYHTTGPDQTSMGISLFFTGKVAAIGPVGRWATPHYRGTGPGDPGITRFKWDIVPLPHKRQTVADIAVVAWTMSSATKHPVEAFDLLQFLCGAQGQTTMAKLGLGIPSLKAVAQSPAFLDGKPDHTQTFLDQMKYARISILPPQQEFTQYLGDEVAHALELNDETPEQATAGLKQRWMSEMQTPLQEAEFPPMNWKVIGWAAAGAIAVIVAVMMLLYRRQQLGSLDRRMEHTGWAFISPWVLGFMFLTLGPMVMSLLLSFTRWTAMSPLNAAQFVGLANFKQLLRFDSDFYPSLRVTGYFALLMVPLGQVAALVVALLMNSKAKFMTGFRTIYYIPTLVGGVTVAAVWKLLLDPQYGLIDHVLTPIAHFFHTTPPDWIGSDAGRWGVPAYVLLSLWAVGSGMLTYLAALKNVPASLYEAARIDGANAGRQFFAVTLPMISPLIFFNLIMAVIGSFQVFAQAYVMTKGGPGNSTLFYVLYLFRQAFEFHNMGYASAMAWVLFVIVLVFTGIIIRTSRRWVYYEGLKS